MARGRLAVERAYDIRCCVVVAGLDGVVLVVGPSVNVMHAQETTSGPRAPRRLDHLLSKSRWQHVQVASWRPEASGLCARAGGCQLVSTDLIHIHQRRASSSPALLSASWRPRNAAACSWRRTAVLSLYTIVRALHLVCSAALLSSFACLLLLLRHSRILQLLQDVSLHPGPNNTSSPAVPHAASRSLSSIAFVLVLLLLLLLAICGRRDEELAASPTKRLVADMGRQPGSARGKLPVLATPEPQPGSRSFILATPVH